MCQSTVFLVKDGEKTELMREVISLEQTPEGLRVATFFDEPKIVRARVERMDLLKHTITLVAEEK